MSETTETNNGDAQSSPFAKVGECLYRHQSSRIYYALVKHAGKQHRKSLKTTDRALANRRLAEFRKKVGALSCRTNAANLSFDDVAKRWLETIKANLKDRSFQRRQNSVNQIRPFLGAMTVKQFSATILEEWATKRSPAIAASTYNNERETIIAVLAYAQLEGLLLDNPGHVLRRRKLPKVAVGIPTKAQFSRLVATLRKRGSRLAHSADLVELLAYSGTRLGEAVEMRWSDVSFEGERFVVTGGEGGTKNHEVREVPLFPALKAFLLTLRDRDQPEPTDYIVRTSSAKNAMRSACVAAELSDFTHHSLRHYFVSNAIEAGVDFKTIAAWVGHKDGGLLVAKTYGHLRDTHSAEMAKRMTFAA